jgi:isoleucyl-tRNA synthetase
MASFAVESDAIAEFVETNKGIVLDELNVKAIERITEADQLIQYRIKPNLRSLGKKYGKGLAEIRQLLKSINSAKLVSEIQANNSIILNNGQYTLTRDDIFIETEAEEGFAAASDGGITVGLSLELSDDLLMEGMVRDLVRVVQNYRKDAGFSVEDRIEISWDLDGQIANAVGKFDGYFRKETLTKHITEKISNPDFTGSLEMNKNTYKINLKKI